MSVLERAQTLPWFARYRLLSDPAARVGRAELASTPRQAAPEGAHVYRPEIDGLRAFAVLAVVLYHFSVPGFGGGFVGVDVFFVISGFLIGGLLWKELEETGTLSLSRFYVRRLRRLAPAFTVMAAACAIAGYWLLLPFELQDFGKSLIAATTYLSNVLFFRQSGYFDTAAEEKLLLHTWSLSVEEQFYLLFPLLLLALRHRPQLVIATLWVGFAGSLLACVALTPMTPTATFFLFPFRAWELLAGVLLAIHGRGAQEKRSMAGAAPSWAGAALLVASVLMVRPGPQFPGLQAIMPVLGTVLVLTNGRHDNAVNRVLAAHGPVFVGLISYSLYLWHWPVIALAGTYGVLMSGASTAVWLLVSFALAWTSWRFVERPFRDGRRLKPFQVLGGAAGATGVLLAMGTGLYLANGLPQRFDPLVRLHIDATADFLQDWSRCNTANSGPLAGVRACPIGPDGPPRFLVWADSHGRAFKEGLDRLAQERGEPGILIWRAGCPPLLGIRKQESAATPQEDRNCAEANIRIQNALPQMSSLEAVLLLGRWAYYAEGEGTGYDSRNRISLLASNGTPFDRQGQERFFGEAVETTVQEIRRTVPEVFVLRQVPEIADYDSRDLARRLSHADEAARTELDAHMRIRLANVQQRTAASEKPFRELASRGAITWIDPWPSFCGAGECRAVQNGHSYFFDNNHITNTAALELRHLFDPVMDALDTDPQPMGSGS